MRMVNSDFSSGIIKTSVETSKWGKKSIYILIDAIDVIDVAGKSALNKE
jgi:hypothetical protein